MGLPGYLIEGEISSYEEIRYKEFPLGVAHQVINANKPHLWKKDIEQSVDMYNNWFVEFAPQTYRDSRVRATNQVQLAFRLSQDLRSVTPDTIKANPQILPTLRMCTAPPLARDRLVGLAYTTKSLVYIVEEGKLPLRMPADELDKHLTRVCETLQLLLDRDLFPWLDENVIPSTDVRDRAATIVADRLCGAMADPIVRNAQERRQLDKIRSFLSDLGYTEEAPEPGSELIDMRPGTFWFRLNVKVEMREDSNGKREVNIPVDAVIQPKELRPNSLPIMIEAKSAGDFTNTNKRRKEEATKVRQLRDTYGESTQLILFLCGYFDAGYLGYEASEGLDWVWEHRIEDLLQLEI